jgi:hypothetical protein
MKPITAFQTSDGTLFATAEPAEKHEMLLSKESVVDEFLDSELNPYKGHAHRSMARNTIVSWELWRSKNEIIAK